MSESNIVRIRVLADGSTVQVLPDGSTIPYVDPTKTDWARFDAMTEEELEANALSDPDSVVLTDEEFARARRAPHPATVRRALGLSQEEFSAQFEIPLTTLRAWEERPGLIDFSAITLLRIIEQDPAGVRAALARSYPAALRPTGD